MSVTIRQTWSVMGVPTAVTSFVLANEAGTIGVMRNDTLGMVVASGTAMTSVGTGVYEYTFTPPAAGLTYTAYYTITMTTGAVWHLQDTIHDTSEDSIPMPDLTGDDLVDTLNSLIVERLRVVRGGPKPGYSISGHRVDWNAYLSILDQRILALRKELAMVSPVEEIGIGI
jgi:hypothetical protein